MHPTVRSSIQVLVNLTIAQLEANVHVYNCNCISINSLTTKKQTTKFLSAKFKKRKVKAISYWEFKD